MLEYSLSKSWKITRFFRKISGFLRKKRKCLKNIKSFIVISFGGLFDARYYLKIYSDVRQADINPLIHYIRYGWQESRNPTEFFDGQYYYSLYPDVKNAKLNPLEHYISYGYYEGRTTNKKNIILVPRLGKIISSIKYIIQLIQSSNPKQIIVLIRKAIKFWRNYGINNLLEKIKQRYHLAVQSELPEEKKDFSSAFYSALNFPEFDYQQWVLENEPSDIELNRQIEISKLLPKRPIISILTPVYNTPKHILKSTIDLVIKQTYKNWELCLVDGNSTNSELRPLLEEIMESDERIKCKFLDENLGISGNTNVALSMSTGEFINLLDHDDEIPPNALFEIVKYFNQHPECDLIYSDEDRITMDGKRHTPFFKPDWSPDILQAGMYIGHSTYRKKLVVDLGGFRSRYDFSQDYDLALRITEKISNVGHIPKVLYHWREVPGSAAIGGKLFARQTNIDALADYLDRNGIIGDAVILPACNKVEFKNVDSPLVSIIIPSDNISNIEKSVNSILNMTSYTNFEIIIVTNLKIIKIIMYKFPDDLVKTCEFNGDYNFSAKCNSGVEVSRGDYVLFLNDDVFPMEENWIDVLIGYFQQSDVGAVSPKLTYSNGSIQHAGLITGVRNLFGTAFHTWPSDSRFYFNLPQMTRSVSALSAACMLMRKSVFVQIGGFDSINTPIAHSDLDLSFKIREFGLRLVYTPHTFLEHVGHLSIRKIENSSILSSSKPNNYMLKRWAKYVEYDPYFPTNMRDALYFDLYPKFRIWLDNSINTEKKNDILMQTHDLSLSGVPIFILDLVTHFKKNNNYVLTISGNDGPLHQDYKNNDLSLIIDQFGINSPEQIIPLIKDFDIVIANTILSYELVLTAKAMNKPVIWIIHEGIFGYSLVETNKRIFEALKTADLVLFPSKDTLSKYRKYNINNNFISTIFGSYSHNKNEFLTNEENKNDNVLNLLHVGSVEERKGQDVLISAYEKLPNSLKKKIKISFVGRVLEQQYFNNQSKRTKKYKNIQWLGSLPHHEVMKHMAESSLLVCTSRDETGPIVVYEAMSLGIPVLASKEGAIPEFLVHGENGYTFDNENLNELVEILTEIITDPSCLITIREETLKTFNEKLDRGNFFLEIDNIVAKLVKKNNLSNFDMQNDKGDNFIGTKIR